MEEEDPRDLVDLYNLMPNDDLITLLDMASQQGRLNAYIGRIDGVQTSLDVKAVAMNGIYIQLNTEKIDITSKQDEVEI